MKDSPLITEFKAAAIEFATQWKERLVVVVIGQEVNHTHDDKFTCSGQLVGIDNHVTAGPQVLCTAHHIMHETEEQTEGTTTTCH